MKLYYAINACSLSPHIVLRELQLQFDLLRVDNKTKTLDDGTDFYSINPKGYVAALQLDDGSIFTEGPAILQYLGDIKPGSGLVPPNATLERVRFQEALNFITSELHAGSNLLFNRGIEGEVRSLIEQRLFKRLDYAESVLTKQTYFTGKQFSAADAYLFTVLKWMDALSISLTRWPHLADHVDRISDRPAVKAAIAAEAAAEKPL